MIKLFSFMIIVNFLTNFKIGEDKVNENTSVIKSELIIEGEEIIVVEKVNESSIKTVAHFNIFNWIAGLFPKKMNINHQGGSASTSKDSKAIVKLGGFEEICLTI
jgi:hypothetical protein